MYVTVDEIKCMSERDLLDPMTFAALFDIEDAFEQAQMQVALQQHADDLRCKTYFNNLLAAFKKRYVDAENLEMLVLGNAVRDVTLELTDKGNPKCSIENFKRILDSDPDLCGRLRYNELTNMPERVHEDGTLQAWTDADSSWLRHFIEYKYRIHSKDKLDDAMNQTFYEHRYHPIRQLICSLHWDGKSRIGTLFPKWLKADDTPYIRECERLVFAGGIHRLFHPGCKFDCNIIFVGGQGCGKTTMSRLLAMDDEYYREVTEIDGQKGIESIRGAWIAEFSELLALKRTKDVEAVKSYITRQVDTYRPPFQHYIESFPRQCIFLGTTNTAQFLNDKTGGRRFLPVQCNSVGRDLYEHEQEIREEIRQCWAEAYAKFLIGEMPPVEDRNLMDEIRQMQESATEDDYRVGMIESYLDAPERDRVCVLEIWQNALNEIGNPKKKDSNEIASILDNIPGWERTKASVRCGKFGKQKAWYRISTVDSGTDEYEF